MKLMAHIVLDKADVQIFSYLSQRMTKPSDSKACVTSKTSDQHVHPLIAKVLIHSSFDSPKAVEGTCSQRTFQSDCPDAQADLSLR